MNSEEQIDDSLYSRQRYVLGDNAMKKMANADVLLVGFGGLGVEIAKNIVLAGVRSLTVMDAKVCQMADLSTQYFIREADVKAGLSRVEAGGSRLSELNPHVSIKWSDEPFMQKNGTWDFLLQFKCVILTEMSFSLQIEVDRFCRSQKPAIPVISGDVIGLFAYGFCDFGDSFEVSDTNGEEPKESFICNITNGCPAVVTVFDARPHNLETGDWVEFREVSGMTELNGQKYQITVVSPYQFSISDTTMFSAYEGGGIIYEVKLPKTIKFRSLEEELKSPTVSIPDFAKLQAPNTIHTCFVAKHLLTRADNYLRYSVSFEEFRAKINELATENQIELDEKLALYFYQQSGGCFAPLCTVFGGVLAQEVIKSLSGKFTPLVQWLHLDACEVLSDLDKELDYNPRGDRYDLLRGCVGEDICQQLSALNVFMIGCGAIGCEMMKLFALLGIGTKGKLTITDNDLIEKSNLNRQFLFRPHHVQKPKSVTAAEASLEMNPDLKINAQLYKVYEGTEDTIHTSEFFAAQDIIINALDNVEARMYMDQRCIDSGKPLLESGTTGTKGHTQVIVPHLTESYSSQRDPTDEDVPFCSLKSFPAKLDHCIIWARNKFESSFTSKPRTFNKYVLEHKDIDVLKSRLTSGEIPKDSSVFTKILQLKPLSWKDCVHLARKKFEKYFSNKAKSLMHAYPLDHRREDGSMFWQLPRRPPHAIVFDPNNSKHIDFIRSSAFLFATTFSIKIQNSDKDSDAIKELLKDAVVPEFAPKPKRIVTDAGEATPATDVDDMEMEAEDVLLLLNNFELKESGRNIPEIACLEFEKDDDMNGHIDFIVATANLRAEMYGIENGDRYKIKRVAGKIIPAIATTTAAVTGLVIIELFKVIRKARLEDYKNCFMNLAIPILVHSEPGPAKVTKIRDDLIVTLWDKIVVKGDESKTLNSFIQDVTGIVGYNVDTVLQGSKIIYHSLIPAYRKKMTERMNTLLKLPTVKPYVDLTVCFTDLPEEIAMEVPPTRYFFK